MPPLTFHQAVKSCRNFWHWFWTTGRVHYWESQHVLTKLLWVELVHTPYPCLLLRWLRTSVLPKNVALVFLLWIFSPSHVSTFPGASKVLLNFRETVVNSQVYMTTCMFASISKISPSEMKNLLARQIPSIQLWGGRVKMKSQASVILGESEKGRKRKRQRPREVGRVE